MSQMSLMILLCGLIAIAIIMLAALLIIACAKPDPSEQQQNKKRQPPGGMTYRDLMEIQHPDMIKPDLLGGVHGCPASFGYTDRIPEMCLLNGLDYTWEGQNRVCHACWNREVPEEEMRGLVEADAGAAKGGLMMDQNGYFEDVFASFGNAMENACRILGQALDCFIENFPKALRLAIPRAVEIAMEDPAMLKRWAKENDRELYRKMKLAKKPRTKEKVLLQVAAEYCLKGTN